MIERRVWIAGSHGLIGSACLQKLREQGYRNLLTPSHSELDLEDPVAVEKFFETYAPQVIILAAGKVGGIVANVAAPADFIERNLKIQINVLGNARKYQVEKLLFFGSSCMYPKDCPQPMGVERLLTGMPEKTSLPYAMAKLSGVTQCLAFNDQDRKKRFIPVIPNSTYGPHDDFSLEGSHVFSALIRKFHEAKFKGDRSITLWGSGKSRREFIFSSDVADAITFLLNRDLEEETLPINIGSGTDYSIEELAHAIAREVGYSGTILWDTSKPDGAYQKLLDSNPLRTLGWQPKIGLQEGIKLTYTWYLNSRSES